MESVTEKGLNGGNRAIRADLETFKASGHAKFLEYFEPDVFAAGLILIFHQIIHNILLKAQLYGDALAEEEFALKHFLIDKHQMNAGEEVFQLLILGKCTEAINGFGIPDQVIDYFFGKVAVFGDPEDHVALHFGEMLVGFGQLD